jgi:hypothetical protein
MTREELSDVVRRCVWLLDYYRSRGHSPEVVRDLIALMERAERELDAPSYCIASLKDCKFLADAVDEGAETRVAGLISVAGSSV